MEATPFQAERIEISRGHLKIVKAILQKHLPVQTRVYVFGSREKSQARRGSDLDLAIDIGIKLSLDLSTNLSSDFKGSDLPLNVDILNIRSTSPTFLSLIEQDFIELVTQGD
jgi:predicted nucleotidyltransferase